jgi:hypothetical protein
LVDSETIASDLEAVLRGTLSGRDFGLRYGGSVRESPLLAATWGGLQHYLADADIRAKDERYRTMQDAEMSKFIRLLWQGAPLAELARISFLGAT